MRFSSILINNSNRLKLTQIIMGCGFLIGVSLSLKLWFYGRTFPTVPLIEILESESHFINFALSFVCCSAVLLWMIFSNRIFILIASISLLVLLLQDQMRWQPWVYIYFVVFVLFYLSHHKRLQLLNCLQFMLVGIYFWAGIHKLNPDFIEYTFGNIVEDMLGIEAYNSTEPFLFIGYVIPIIEIAIGLLLLFPKTRTKGIILAIISHIFTVLYLSPLFANYNFVVIPWNFAMMSMVITIFLKNENAIISSTTINRKQILSITIIVLFWLLPSFNFINRWDNYLSMRLYSGQTKLHYLAIAEEEIHKLQPSFSEYFVDFQELAGGKTVDLQLYSMDELGVPIVPEERVINRIYHDICTSYSSIENKVFLRMSRSLKLEETEVLECESFNSQ